MKECTWATHSNLSLLTPKEGKKLKRIKWDFPGGQVVKNLPANAGFVQEDSTCQGATKPVRHSY